MGPRWDLDGLTIIDRSVMGIRRILCLLIVVGDTGLI